MPIPAYLTISKKENGEKLSDVALSPDSVGTLSQKRFENAIIIQSFDHTIEIPRDYQTGQPAGQRVHMPVKMTKLIDKSSPLLYDALVNGEQLQCVIDWYRLKGDGTLEKYFIITLDDAIILDIKAYMPNCQDPAQKHFTHLEEISVSYKKINWHHNISNTDGDDSWDQPK